jgi:hypothetical protein
MNYIKENITKIAIAISLIFYIPVLLSRSNFLDDIYRSASANPDYWFENARPLSVLLYRFINQGYLAPDLSPLTFIITFVLMSLASKLVADYACDKEKTLLWGCVFVLFMCNPMFLSNASYKYDSPTMAAAILLSVLSVLLSNSKIALDIAVKIALTFFMLCFYQPAIGVVIGLIPLKAMKSSNGEIKAFIMSLIKSSLALVVAYVIYKLTIIPWMLNAKYMLASSTLPLSYDSMWLLYLNIKSYLGIAWMFSKSHSTTIFILITMVSGFISLASNKPKTTKLMALISLPFIFLSLITPNALLARPAFNTREMVSFSIPFIYAMWLVSTSFKNKDNSYAIILMTLLFTWPAICTSYSFLNYKDATQKRNSILVNDIKNTISNYGANKVKAIAIENNVGPLLMEQSSAIKAYPLIDKLRGDDGFGGTWYGIGVMSREYAISMPISRVPFDNSKMQLSTCHSQSYLDGKVLHIRLGNYC